MKEEIKGTPRLPDMKILVSRPNMEDGLHSRVGELLNRGMDSSRGGTRSRGGHHPLLKAVVEPHSMVGMIQGTIEPLADSSETLLHCMTSRRGEYIETFIILFFL